MAEVPRVKGKGRKRGGLTPKQRRFALEYLVDFNATQAAVRAGYSGRSAYSQAHDLLKKPEVDALLAAAVKAREEQLSAESNRVLSELERVAYSDLAAAFEEDGLRLRNIREIPEPLRRAISSFEVVEYFEQVPDDEGKPRREQVGWIKKVKLAGKVEALALLGKNQKLFSERLQLDGADGKPVSVSIAIGGAK